MLRFSVSVTLILTVGVTRILAGSFGVVAVVIAAIEAVAVAEVEEEEIVVAVTAPVATSLRNCSDGTNDCDGANDDCNDDDADAGNNNNGDCAGF